MMTASGDDLNALKSTVARMTSVLKLILLLRTLY